MTEKQLRKHPEYIKSKNKIESYPQGFTFTIPYYKMTEGQRNAMDVITYDCINEGLLKSVSMDLALNGKVTQETFTRL